MRGSESGMTATSSEGVRKSELPEHFTMSVSQIVEETTEVVKNVSDW